MRVRVPDTHSTIASREGALRCSMHSESVRNGIVMLCAGCAVVLQGCVGQDEALPPLLRQGGSKRHCCCCCESTVAVKRLLLWCVCTVPHSIHYNALAENTQSARRLLPLFHTGPDQPPPLLPS